MLRFAREADLPEMLEIYAPYVLNTTVSFEYAPPSPAEFRRRFTEYTKQFPWLVWEEGNRILGYAYASAPFTREAYQWCAEPTIYLRREAQGKDIARKLYAVLEEILFSLMRENHPADDLLLPGLQLHGFGLQLKTAAVIGI